MRLQACNFEQNPPPQIKTLFFVPQGQNTMGVCGCALSFLFVPRLCFRGLLAQNIPHVFRRLQEKNRH